MRPFEKQQVDEPTRAVLSPVLHRCGPVAHAACTKVLHNSPGRLHFRDARTMRDQPRAATVGGVGKLETATPRRMFLAAVFPHLAKKRGVREGWGVGKLGVTPRRRFTLAAFFSLPASVPLTADRLARWGGVGARGQRAAVEMEQARWPTAGHADSIEGFTRR
jgi:hypothetical protein